MKLGKTFRFEFTYQVRRVSTWLYFAALFAVSWSVIQGNYIHDARDGYLQVNAPLVVASTMVIGCLMWLFVAASIAGDAAARDIESGMHPLAFSAPVRKRDYLGGRFLAAYALNALLLLAVPAGMLLGMRWPDVEAEIVGPWRPQAFLQAYVLIGLPNAFIATAVQFAFAALGRRAILSYFGSLVLFFGTLGLAAFVSVALRQPELARVLDPVGMIAIVSHMSDTWTTTEINTRLVGLQPLLLANRALWLLVGAAVLAFTYARFRLAHPMERGRRGRRLGAKAALREEGDPVSTFVERGPATVATSRNEGSFGRTTPLRQLFAVANRSLRTLAQGWTVFAPLAVVAVMTCITVPARMEFVGVPLLPRTEHVLTFLTSALANPDNRVWMIIPLLIIFYAGELVWGERDARMGEISGAAPVPDWVFFVGKFFALALVLFGWMVVLGVAGMVGQAVLGYHHFEIGLYAKALLGLQLLDYLLFALLALTVHTVVNQKHMGTLVALVLYALISFAPMLGVEHNMLVFGAGPAWSYSDISSFGGSVPAWLVFKAYWLAWAVVLAVLARLALVRGRESGIRARLQLARARFTRPTTITAAIGAAMVLGLGAGVFYNTNVLNHYRSSSEATARGASYERLYARYAKLSQPRATASSLRVEIYPQQRRSDISGSYRLMNPTAVAIDTVHIATSTAGGVETRLLSFDRPATLVLDDDDLGHRIYTLATPLQPGETMQLSFEVRFAPRGFGNRGLDESVVANGSWVSTASWLPAIGYQPARELQQAGDRLTHGLPARPLVPVLEDQEARNVLPGDVGIQFDAVVGTSDGQVAIAPGVLRRDWHERGRHYFHYTSDAPIREDVQFFSGRYAVRQDTWNGVTIQVFHHPAHASVVDRMARSARASLDLYTSLFGPYPYRTLRIVENAGRGIGAHSEPSLVDYGDGFALLNPGTEPQDLDLVFAVTAHEVAHQWWGGQGLAPARVEGVGFLIESLATYSAMQVVESALGHDQLLAYLEMIRSEAAVPRSRASPPLLRAADQFLNYRKGPLAMYTLGQYLGRDQVNLALRRLLEKHPHGSTQLATTLDLYRELQAVTPNDYRGLLHDLLAANAYWELSATRSTKRSTATGRWDLTVELQARKLVVDDAGAEIDQPLDEWVEVGVFAGPARKQENGQVVMGKPMYLKKHRLRDARQTITISVPREPGHVGIDPRTLLFDVRPRNNFVEVGNGERAAAR